MLMVQLQIYLFIYNLQTYFKEIIAFANKNTSLNNDAFKATKSNQELLHSLYFVSVFYLHRHTYFVLSKECLWIKKKTGRGKQKTQNLKCHTVFLSMRSLHMLYWFMHFLNTQPLKGISAGTEHGDRLN